MSLPRKFEAAPEQNKKVPAWMATKLDGTYKKRVYKKTLTGLVSEEVDAPCGWLIQFPKGHSIHVPTEEEMERLGYTALEGPLVALDGDPKDGQDIQGITPVSKARDK